MSGIMNIRLANEVNIFDHWIHEKTHIVPGSIYMRQLIKAVDNTPYLNLNSWSETVEEYDQMKRWLIVKEKYVSIRVEIRYYGSLITGKITPRGQRVVNCLENGLVWCVDDGVSSISATKAWYLEWLDSAKRSNSIPDEIFRSLANVKNLDLDAEMQAIKSKFILHKLSSELISTSHGKSWVATYS